jgi:hypothetical protein
MHRLKPHFPTSPPAFCIVLIRDLACGIIYGVGQIHVYRKIFIMAFISDGSILSTLSLLFISLLMPIASRLLYPTAAKDSV